MSCCVAGIDFDEFLAMYKRLFVLCKSVVSNDVTDLLSPRTGKKASPRKVKQVVHLLLSCLVLFDTNKCPSTG